MLTTLRRTSICRSRVLNLGRNPTFGVRIVGMTVHCGWLSTIEVWDITKETPSIAISSYFLSKQWRCEQYGTNFYVTLLAVDFCAIKIKNDWIQELIIACDQLIKVGRCVPPQLCCWWVWTLKLDCWGRLMTRFSGDIKRSFWSNDNRRWNQSTQHEQHHWDPQVLWAPLGATAHETFPKPDTSTQHWLFLFWPWG